MDARNKGGLHTQSFESCGTPEEMRRYLQMVLTRVSGANKETTYLYRYTKINRLTDMLKTGYMRLGPCYTMNDDFETAVLDRHGLLKRLFYACFTKADESLAMYKLYGIDRNSVIFRISYAGLEKFVMENVEADSGEKYTPIHSFNIWRNKEVTSKLVSGQLYCTGIGYVDPKTKEIKAGTKTNKRIRSPFNQAVLAGKIKYRCWAYEEEVRLCCELPTPLADKECVAVKLPNGFDSMISVILCPGFDKEGNKDHLLELNVRGINFTPSAYDPIYSKFINSDPRIEETEHQLETI